MLFQRSDDSMTEQQKFNFYTIKILEGLPYWFQMKQKPSQSIGAAFLNIIGLSLQEVRFMLDYGFKQAYIQSCDETLLESSYKSLIPVHHDISLITEWKIEGQVLEAVEELQEFYNREEEFVCFVDSERNIVYFHQSGTYSAQFEHGQLTYVLGDVDYQTPIYYHSIWNFLDEFGLLFDCSRLKNESNRSYKERLLDVFKHPGGASKFHLLNAIGRELGCRRYETWEDGTQDFILSSRMVALNQIEVEDQIYPMEQIEITPDYRIKLNSDGCSQPRQVTYIEGVELHQLHRYKLDDYKLRNELLTLDYEVLPLFKYYVKRIQSESSIEWGRFRWDEAVWTTRKDSTFGDGCLPSLYDSSILGFRNYKD